MLTYAGDKHAFDSKRDSRNSSPNRRPCTRRKTIKGEDYFDIIKTPMDFGTICNELEHGNKYMNSKDVLKDVEFIWMNCYRYCNKGDYILDLMKRVKKVFLNYWMAAGLYYDPPKRINVLSGNGETSAVMKGITHGAYDYLLKPGQIKELRNIWQHVITKKKVDSKDHNNFDHGSDPEKVHHGTCEGGEGPNTTWPADQNGKLIKKRKDQNEDDEDEFDDNGNENEDPSAQKKPRVVWSGELHCKFVAAVNQLGIDEAVPKRILELMNVEKLTRENVSSHLQKYRLYLKRISCVASQQANMVAALPMGVSLTNNDLNHRNLRDNIETNPLYVSPIIVLPDSLHDSATKNDLQCQARDNTETNPLDVSPIIVVPDSLHDSVTKNDLQCQARLNFGSIGNSVVQNMNYAPKNRWEEPKQGYARNPNLMFSSPLNSSVPNHDITAPLSEYLRQNSTICNRKMDTTSISQSNYGAHPFPMQHCEIEKSSSGTLMKLKEELLEQAALQGGFNLNNCSSFDDLVNAIIKRGAQEPDLLCLCSYAGLPDGGLGQTTGRKNLLKSLP